MVAVKEKFPRLSNGHVDMNAWLQHIIKKYTPSDTTLIQKATQLILASPELTTFYGQPCIEQGLEMADILLDLKLDQDTIVASIILSAVDETHLTVDAVQEQLSESIAKLIRGVKQANILDTLPVNINKTRNIAQIDRLRKTFLAMVSDIRVVLIKLAERVCIMRGIKNSRPDERQQLAQETLDIYAPLANRLGIGQIKWELEDISFHYVNPEAYKKIATFLSERRIDRENRIQEIIVLLREQFAKTKIKATITGRAKHIYSIYLKAQKKQLDYNSIFDYSALRILVPTLDDCYTALSIVNSLWEHIPEEFDDYIAYPKPNGYRSIHTAVFDHTGKQLEIQIRTYDMHDEAEHGVAAHWLYKEGKQLGDYEGKVTFLRQLLAWHRELAQHDHKPDKTFQEIFEDRIYVFTPTGDIIDLPAAATPLDFAYHIHSNLGHRCRGAKVNGHIVQLTHALHTGDRVDIITTQNGIPSRDWLNKEAGYIKTARARTKIAQFFKQQDVNQYIQLGKNALERELSRVRASHVDVQKIATRLNFKNADALLSSIGHGSLKAGQVAHTIQCETNSDTSHKPIVPSYPKIVAAPTINFQISGVNDLLTRVAKCCKPIPGDTIIGYITQGHGVSIHRQNCNNLSHLTKEHTDRLIHVNWISQQLGTYFVDLQIRAQNREGLLKEITTLVANIKINLVKMNSNLNQKNNLLFILMTVQVQSTGQLQQLIHLITQVEMVHEVKRLS